MVSSPLGPAEREALVLLEPQRLAPPRSRAEGRPVEDCVAGSLASGNCSFSRVCL